MHFSTSHICATCPTHLTLLDLIITPGEEYPIVLRSLQYNNGVDEHNVITTEQKVTKWMTHCILHTQKSLIGYRHATHDVTHHQDWNSPTRAKISDTWDVTPCSLVEVYQHFWVNCALHLHGGNSMQKTETYILRGELRSSGLLRSV